MHALDGARLYHNLYRRGQVTWPTWPFQENEPLCALDHDEYHAPDVCLGGWHPPLRLIPDEKFSGRAAALAVRISHPQAATIGNHKARAFFIAEQFEEMEFEMHVAEPCTWCGLFTGCWCDGIPPARGRRGWQCRHALCSFCESLFQRCKWCAVWTPMPTAAPQDAVQRCGTALSRYGELTRYALATRYVPLERWPSGLRETFGRREDEAPDEAASVFDWFLSTFLSEIGCGIPSSNANFIGAMPSVFVAAGHGP